MTSELPPGIAVTTQYVKDLSFENPRAPQGFMMLREKPKIDVAINIEARPFPENAFEVTLQVTAKASARDKEGGEFQPVFVADVSYAGLFTLANVPQEMLEAILLIVCPNLLFPYVRRIISDATRDGGYMPLLLDPVDFQALYHHRKQQQQPKEEEHAQQYM